MRPVQLLPVLFLALATSGTAARAADEMAVERGKALAEEVCSLCHVVNGGRGSDAVPSFHAIAADPETTDARIRGFVYEPHPQMPALQLEERQIDDLVAYLRSLEG
jgi:mono/diheme cytochrome c family protein